MRFCDKLLDHKEKNETEDINSAVKGVLAEYMAWHSNPSYSQGMAGWWKAASVLHCISC